MEAELLEKESLAGEATAENLTSEPQEDTIEVQEDTEAMMPEEMLNENDDKDEAEEEEEVHS